jgi:UDP-glucose 4-epimerase
LRRQFKEAEMNTALVTGSNGFIGQSVCKKLLQTGWKVLAAVRTPSGAAGLPEGVVPIVAGPVEAFSSWGEVLRDVDAVVHLAARVHVLKEKSRDPLPAFRAVNVEGTCRLLEGCRRARVRRFLLVSSIGVVGSSSRTPVRETSPYLPQTPYGISKREAEEATFEAARAGGFEAVVIRPPMVYGPGCRGNFPRIVNAVKRGIPLPLRSVRNARSMCYVENLADAIRVCLTHPQAAGEVFHVADGDPVSTPDLVRFFAGCVKRPRLALPVLVPAPVLLMRLAGKLLGRGADMDRLLGSCVVGTQKIRGRLGWEPPYRLVEGIRRTLGGDEVRPARREDEYRRAA